MSAPPQTTAQAPAPARPWIPRNPMRSHLDTVRRALAVVGHTLEKDAVAGYAIRCPLGRATPAPWVAELIAE